MSKDNRLKKKMNDSRGLMAVDAIIGVILSVIALLFLINIIANYSLGGPENFQIARDNMNSIAEFIDYSEDRYGTYDNCFTMLKLINLESFQYEKEGDNFFYVIGSRGDKRGVYLINKIYLADFIKDKDLFDVVIADQVEFDKALNIKLDNTDDSKITFDIEFFTVGKRATQLDLSSDAEYIILVPKFKNDDYTFGIFDVLAVDNEDNLLMGSTFVGDDEEVGDGFYLVYSPKTDELFLTKSEYSNSLTKYSSCSYADSKFVTYDNYVKNNPYKADFVNEELVFDYVIDGEVFGYEFTWRVGDISCPGSLGCDSVLGSNYNDLSYSDFIVKIDSYYKGMDEFNRKGGEKILKIVRRTPLSIVDVENGLSGKDVYYDYENVFFKYDNDELLSGDIEDKLEEVFGDEAFRGFNSKREDDCSGERCNYVGYKNYKAYYYDDDLKSFVSFNQNMLIMDSSNNVYFGGKKVDYEVIDLDDVGISIFRENYEFFKFDVEVLVNGKVETKTVLMTSFQSNQVDRRYDK